MENTEKAAQALEQAGLKINTKNTEIMKLLDN